MPGESEGLPEIGSTLRGTKAGVSIGDCSAHGCSKKIIVEKRRKNTEKMHRSIQNSGVGVEHVLHRKDRGCRRGSQAKSGLRARVGGAEKHLTRRWNCLFVVVVVGDDAVAATGEHVVLLVRCGNSILVVAVGCSMVDVEWLPQKK